MHDVATFSLGLAFSNNNNSSKINNNNLVSNRMLLQFENSFELALSFGDNAVNYEMQSRVSDFL